MTPQQSPPLSESERRAFGLAMFAHRGQVDKAGEPYIYHVHHVGMRAHAFGEKFGIVGFLHDVWEDTDVSIHSIASAFGPDVAMSVVSVSRWESETYAAFIERAAQDRYGRVVKLLDVEHHLQRAESLPESLRGRYENARTTLYLSCATNLSGATQEEMRHFVNVYYNGNMQKNSP